MDNRAGAKPPLPQGRVTPHPSLDLLMLLRVYRDPRAHKRTGSIPTQRLVHKTSVVKPREMLFQEVNSHLKEAAVEGLA